MNGPIFFAAAVASATDVYGPACNVNVASDVELTVNDMPRAIIAASWGSDGSFAESARSRSHVVATSPAVFAKTPGSPASAYVPASFVRSVSASATATTASRTGPAAFAVAERVVDV